MANIKKIKINNTTYDVYDAGAERKTTVTNVSATGSVSQQLSPNVFYKFGSISSLNITLASGTGLTVYSGKFTASSDNITVTLPSTVKFPKDTVSIASGCTYEFNIADGICILKDVTTES